MTNSSLPTFPAKATYLSRLSQPAPAFALTRLPR